MQKRNKQPKTRREIIQNSKKRREELLRQFNELCKKHEGYSKAEFARLHGVSAVRMGELLK